MAETAGWAEVLPRLTCMEEKSNSPWVVVENDSGLIAY